MARPQGSAPDIGAFESRGFTLSLRSGNGQAVPVNTAFAPLSVNVISSYGEPVAGGTVTFTAPGSGASASLTGSPASISSAGVASVNATANGTAGSYQVTANTSGAGAGVSFSLTNQAVNHAPVLSGANNLAAINEDDSANSGTLVSSLISGRISDSDAGALQGIAVTAVSNSNGTWQYSTNGGSTWTAFGSPSSTAARPLAADNNTRVRFVPNGNWSGTVTNGITFRAWDQTSGTAGSTADTSSNGGATAFSSATASASITVNPVNDPPVGAGKTVTTLEDTAYTFGTGDFAFTDPNDNPANGLLAVKITSLPSAGSLTNSGTPVTAGQFITAASLAGGQLRFIPAANGNGTPYASFTFQVQDDGGTANGGINLDPNPKTLTVNVTPVNDPPTFTKGSDQSTKAGAGAQTVANWATNISSGPANESGQSLTFLVGTNSDGLFTVKPAISSNGTLTYTPAATGSGTAIVTVQLQDSGGTTNGGQDISPAQTFIITVALGNTAPVLDPIGNKSINEGSLLSFTATARDNDTPAQTLTYNLITPPQGARIDPTTGLFTWTPDREGSYPFSVQVTDNGSPALSATQPLTITVSNVAPAVSVGADAAVGTNSAFTRAGAFVDPGTDAWTATVDYNDGHGAQPLALNGKQFTLSHTYTAPGTYTIVVSVNDGVASGTGTMKVTVGASQLQVLSFTPTPSGFDVVFNKAVDLTPLNLYDGMDAAVDLPDLTLVGQRAGTIDGSLIWEAASNTLHFVKAGGLLAADNYTVTLFSRADGFVGLDGDKDGTAGGNYQGSFAVTTSASEPVLSLPDFARGPRQAVNVPVKGTGLPIHLENAQGVQSVDFQLMYDPNLLTLSDVVLANGLPADWIPTSNLQTPGQALLSVYGTTVLSAGAKGLVAFKASIPASASYGSIGMLKLANVKVNDQVALGDTAVQVVAYLGDASGNKAYSGLDAAYIANVSVKNVSGFDAFPLLDPLILGDVSGNGSLGGLDASLVAQKSIGMTRPEIPDLPSSQPVPQASPPAAAADMPLLGNRSPFFRSVSGLFGTKRIGIDILLG